MPPPAPPPAGTPPTASTQVTEPVPLGQRFFDNVLLLLAICLIIMLVVFTGWGLWEILSLPKATLP